jgi:hypothetical protein
MVTAPASPAAPPSAPGGNGDNSMERNSGITSIPGTVAVTGECLPGSTLPAELRKAGYDVRDIGDGERIVATAITERFCRGADGELEPLTSGSTRAVAQVVAHAGVCKVKRYAFRMI